jgi:hypothetical protein
VPSSSLRGDKVDSTVRIPDVGRLPLPCVLAGTTPWELNALVLAKVHRSRVATRDQGERPCLEELRRVRALAQREALEVWGEALCHPAAGHRTIDAIRPVLEEWVGPDVHRPPTAW